MALDPTNPLGDRLDPLKASESLAETAKLSLEQSTQEQEQEQKDETYKAVQQDARDNPEVWGIQGVA